jgi:hypothetical protein
MVFAIFISYVLAFLPLVFFLVAAVVEWRSAQKGMALFLRMGETAHCRILGHYACFWEFQELDIGLDLAWIRRTVSG